VCLYCYGIPQGAARSNGLHLADTELLEKTEVSLLAAKKVNVRKRDQHNANSHSHIKMEQVAGQQLMREDLH
jgi:hypothetical protein